MGWYAELTCNVGQWEFGKFDNKKVGHIMKNRSNCVKLYCF